jgi:hypothetical protein
MNHTFNIDIAKKFGLEEAILLENFAFWIAKNKANKKHFYENSTWTYNSASALFELFPYWSERKISRIIDSLVDQNLIQKGNFNTVKYDRTLWYSFTDFGESIYRICQIHLSNLSNGLTENVEPIPVINTDIKTNINSNVDYIEFHFKQIDKQVADYHSSELAKKWLLYKKNIKSKII